MSEERILSHEAMSPELLRRHLEIMQARHKELRGEIRASEKDMSSEAITAKIQTTKQLSERFRDSMAQLLFPLDVRIQADIEEAMDRILIIEREIARLETIQELHKGSL